MKLHGFWKARIDKTLANGLGSLRAVAGRQHAIISGDAVGANMGRRHITVEWSIGITVAAVQYSTVWEN